MGWHHDFLMSVVMQNNRNAWLSLHARDPSTVSFEETMTELAEELYSHSLDL